MPDNKELTVIIQDEEGKPVPMVRAALSYAGLVSHGNIERDVISDKDGKCSFGHYYYSKNRPGTPHSLQIGGSKLGSTGSFFLSVSYSTNVKFDPSMEFLPGTYYITIDPKRINLYGHLYTRKGEAMDLRQILALVFPEAKIINHGHIVLPSLEADISDHCPVQTMLVQIPETVFSQSSTRSLFFFAFRVKPYKKPWTEYLSAWESYIVYAVIEWTPEGIKLITRENLFEKDFLREKTLGHFGLAQPAIEKVDSKDVIVLYYSYAPASSSFHEAAKYFALSETLELKEVKSVDKIRK